MDHQIFRTPVLGWFFRLAGAIPIAAQRDNAAIYAQAFEHARRVLDDGDLLCIFPEGAITRDGASISSRAPSLTEPVRRRMTPMMARSVVVLPAPLRPRSVTT